ncbi:MAG: class I SAM-dependent methyltransferase [Ignavibacteriales bacterium]|nr:class I SAM-dependent methyltransferase [Ignavibacteriales bacterium]
MNTRDQFIQDVIEWDVVNWSKCLPFFLENAGDIAGKEALAIGERHGGLSLWLSKQGANVISSDLNGVTPEAREMHKLYGVSHAIKYANADLTSLSYPDNTFDIVMFKSVLGALRSIQNQQKGISEIYRVLKPGGTLLFAENLVASPLHTFLRRKFIKWATYWRYITIDETAILCQKFSSFTYLTAGFTGAFGRSEMQRSFLGKLDSLFEKVVPEKNHYIIFVVCKK